MHGDDPLRDHQRPQTERIAKHIRRLPVNLPGHNAGAVSDSLLQTDLHGTTVVRRDVDVQPGDVESHAGVGRDAAEIGGEVFDGVVGDGQEKNVADDAKDVTPNQELC